MKFSLPEPWRISVEITPQVPRENLCLQVRDKAERRHLVQKGVASLLLLALLPSGQHGAAPFVGEKHRAAITGFEITRPQLATVEKRKRQPFPKTPTYPPHPIQRHPE